MTQDEIFKQMTEFNRTVFENTFNTIALLQDQAERTVSTFWEQSTFLPREGDKIFEAWVKVCKAGRESFRNHTNAAFNKVETFLAESRND